jgi:hypothetical protein
LKRTILKVMQRVLVAIVVVAAVAVWVLPLQADLLSYSGDAYTDPSAITWAGSSSYNDFNALAGSVEYVVFPPGGFAVAFPTSPWQAPANEFVYAYQIENTGPSDASTLGVTVNFSNAHDNIGSFPLDAGDVQPLTAEFEPDAPDDVDTAHWFFSGPSIPPLGGSSVGLAYASPDPPENWFGTLIDSGLNASAAPLPGPSADPVPEPSTAILLAAAAILLGVVRRFRCGRA